MISSLINYYSETKSYINEALLADDSRRTNCLISAIPLIGLISLTIKGISTSKQLLLSINEGDIPKSIKLINIKNCQQFYGVIHLIATVALYVFSGAFHADFSFYLAATMVASLGAIIISNIGNIHTSHEVIDEIQKPNHSFVVLTDSFHDQILPRMRHNSTITPNVIWKLLAQVDCAVQNDLTRKFKSFTIR